MQPPQRNWLAAERRASAPLSCNEHIWPPSLGPPLHNTSPWIFPACGPQQEINGDPCSSGLQATPAFFQHENSHLASLTLEHFWHKSVCRRAARARQEVAQTERVITGRDVFAAADVFLCGVRGMSLGVGAGRKGGNGSLPLTMSLQRWTLCVRAKCGYLSRLHRVFFLIAGSLLYRIQCIPHHCSKLVINIIYYVIVNVSVFVWTQQSFSYFWMLKRYEKDYLCRQPTKIENEFDIFLMNFLKMGIVTHKASQPLQKWNTDWQFCLISLFDPIFMSQY